MALMIACHHWKKQFQWQRKLCMVRTMTRHEWIGVWPSHSSSLRCSLLEDMVMEDVRQSIMLHSSNYLQVVDLSYALGAWPTWKAVRKGTASSERGRNVFSSRNCHRASVLRVEARCTPDLRPISPSSYTLFSLLLRPSFYSEALQR